MTQAYLELLYLIMKVMGKRAIRPRRISYSAGISDPDLDAELQYECTLMGEVEKQMNNQRSTKAYLTENIE